MQYEKAKDNKETKWDIKYIKIHGMCYKWQHMKSIWQDKHKVLICIWSKSKLNWSFYVKWYDKMYYSIGVVISLDTKVEGISFSPFNESITFGDSVHIDVFNGRAWEKITSLALIYIYIYIYRSTLTKLQYRSR